jgi:chaperonin GroES
MKIKPIGGHIVLKPVDAETTTASGIIIPDTAKQDRPERGEVVAVGPGQLLENGSRQEVEVSVGQTVIFKKYSADEVKVEGQEFLVISQSDIIAIIEK